MTLQEAREARKWSLNEAAKRAGIGHQGLANLEQGKVDPGKIQARAMLSLIRLYWPDVALAEFFGFALPLDPIVSEVTLFEIRPRDNFAWAHLISESTSAFRIARS